MEFFYAILTGVITSFLSLTPGKIYDKFLKAKELIYSVEEIPELKLNNHSNKILSLAINNSGRRALNNVQVEVKTISGLIEKYEIKDPSIIKPHLIESSKNILSVNVTNLHPKESFYISLLLHIVNQQDNLKINLRSNEVVGKSKSTFASDKKRISIG